MNIQYTHPQQIKMDNLEHFFFLLIGTFLYKSIQYSPLE